jgi:serine phosphatase RsbU (regulator of sigma subunit)
MLSYYTERKFTSHTVPLEKGSTYYLFSDGYQDQFGGKEGKKFMVKKFRELLLKSSELPMSKQESFLQENFTAWKGKEKQVDDLLVLGFKVDDF